MHFYGFTISLMKHKKLHLSIFGFLHQKNKNSTLVFLDFIVTDKNHLKHQNSLSTSGIYFSSLECILEYAKIINTFL